jgi:dephospho-CoA kinase
VCKILADLGAKIVSADDLARAALAPGSRAVDEVRAIFGQKVFDNGVLNRKAVGELIFNNPALRQNLEDITHPVIGELAETAFKKLAESGAKVLVYDCPLYFESKLKDIKFKGIILVTADESIKISRITARDGVTSELAKQRLANQLSDKERIPLSNIVIENNGSLSELKTKVNEVFRKL